MESSSEFRSVHSAKEALTQYVESGRDLATIESKIITNYDVWISVFSRAEELDAVRAIQIKDLRNQLTESERLLFDRVVKAGNLELELNEYKNTYTQYY